MTNYAVKASGSRVVVTARSSIHDTETRWERLTGTVEADPETLASAGATGSIEVDMTAFDAGDWLKNRKLKKDLEVAKHPRAVFALTELADVTRDEDGTFRATARGEIAWRGRRAPIEAAGSGVVTSERIEASAEFELDVTKLGVKPPKILMIKVEDVVTVRVTLALTAERE